MTSDITFLNTILDQTLKYSEEFKAAVPDLSDEAAKDLAYLSHSISHSVSEGLSHMVKNICKSDEDRGENKGGMAEEKEGTD